MGYAIQSYVLFFFCIPSRNFYHIFFKVSCTLMPSEQERPSFHILQISNLACYYRCHHILPAHPGFSGCPLSLLPFHQLSSFLLITFINWNNNNLQWCDLWGQNQSFVITMRHYQRTNQPCTYAPTGGPYIFQLVFFIRKFNIKCFGKILSEEM